MALLELDDAFLRDERFSELGELTGRGKWDARARVEALWFDCILKTKDVRTSDEIDNFTGWFDMDRGRFAELMVKARLSERVLDTSNQLLGYRIKGVGQRMKWLVDYREKRSENGSKGGKTTAAKAKRGPDGKFISVETQAEPKQVLGDSQANPIKLQHQPTLPVPGPVSVPDSVKEEKGKKLSENPVSNFLFACKATWQGTLDHFKTGRKISRSEEEAIARALIKHDAETVDLALYGARYEPIVDTFMPKDHVSIARVLEPDRQGKLRIDKFANWGGQARVKERAKIEIPKNHDTMLDDVPPPEAVMQLMGKWSKGMKSMPKESANESN